MPPKLMHVDAVRPDADDRGGLGRREVVAGFTPVDLLDEFTQPVVLGFLGQRPLARNRTVEGVATAHERILAYRFHEYRLLVIAGYENRPGY
jgi:hypothetical protein